MLLMSVLIAKMETRPGAGTFPLDTNVRSPYHRTHVRFALLRRRAVALAALVCIVAFALLALPGSSSGARPARQHVVLPGETLWGIASAAYGGDIDSHVQAIARASHLHSALIVPGQALVLP